MRSKVIEGRRGCRACRHECRGSGLTIVAIEQRCRLACRRSPQSAAAVLVGAERRASRSCVSMPMVAALRSAKLE